MITNLIHGFIAAIQILLFGIFLKKFSRFISNRTQKIFLYILLIEHLVIGLLAYRFTIQNPISDVNGYIKHASSSVPSMQFNFVGHDFFILCYRFLFKIGFNFELIFLFSILLSSIPFILLYKRYTELDTQKISWLQFTLLLPSFHFWSVMPGKDCVVFTALILILYKLKTQQISKFILVPLLFLFLVRPYVGAIVLVFLGVGLYIANKRIMKKWMVLPFVFIGLLIIVFFLKQFVNLDSLSLQSISLKLNSYRYYSEKNLANTYLAELGYLGRLLMLLCLPLFYQVKTYFQLASSIENAMIIVFVLYFFFKKFYIHTSNWKRLDVKFAFYTAISIFLFLSTYMYNLGLASRMRLMFYPLLFYAMAQSQKNEHFKLNEKEKNS